jgi:hypothetical protein
MSWSREPFCEEKDIDGTDNQQGQTFNEGDSGEGKMQVDGIEVTDIYTLFGIFEEELAVFVSDQFAEQGQVSPQVKNPGNGRVEYLIADKRVRAFFLKSAIIDDTLLKLPQFSEHCRGKAGTLGRVVIASDRPMPDIVSERNFLIATRN